MKTNLHKKNNFNTRTSRLTKYVLVLLFGLFALSTAEAQNYYVAADGNNNNPGTKEKPWKTITKAASTVQAGATVFIRKGTYHENIEPARSGTASKKITYTNYQNETVKVVGNSAKEPVVKIRKSHIVIKGLTLYHEKLPNCKGYGDCWNYQSNVIEIRYKDAHHNEILNNKIISPYPLVALDSENYIKETGVSVAAGANYNLIQGNEIRKMSKIGIALGKGAKFTKIINNTIVDIYQDCIHYGSGKGIISGTLIEGNILAGSVRSDGIQCNSDIDENRGIIIRNNIMYNNAENNIDLKGTKYIIIEGNTLYSGEGDNDGGCKPHSGGGDSNHDRGGGTGGIGHGGSTKSYEVIIRNNIIYDNNSGLLLRNKSRGWMVYNNTIANNSRDYNGPNSDYTWTRKPIFTGIRGGSPQKNHVIKNNIIGDNPQTEMDAPGSMNCDYNLYFNTYKAITFAHFKGNHDWDLINFNQWKNIINGDQHSLTTTNPQFVNVPSRPNGNHSKYNFSLQSNSPAIDKGNFLTTTSSGGSGKQIKVKDARFFYNGFGVTQGDLVQFEGQTQTARVTQVNYNTNTITVDKSLTWTSGQGISLPYSGSSPDIGAFEYGGTPPAVIDVTGVSLSPTTKTLNIGSTQQLTATVSPSNASNKSVKFTSNNAAVATVSDKGWVKAIKAGTATITVTTNDKSKTATAKITVKAGDPDNDTESPSTPSNLKSNNVTSSTVNLAWQKATDNVGVKIYEVYVYNGSYTKGSKVIRTIVVNAPTTSVKATGLKAKTTYSFRVRARDAAKNLSGASNAVTVTTKKEEASNYTLTTSISLKGTISLSPSGGTYKKGTVVTVTAKADTGNQFDNWSGNLTGSTNPQKITMNGNKSVKAHFSVASNDDTEKPSTPSSLKSNNVTSNTVDLSWGKSTDNKGVILYEVYVYKGTYKQGDRPFRTEKVTAPTTSVTYTDLKATTTYSFRVRARDAAENLSGASNAVTITTKKKDIVTDPTCINVKPQAAYSFNGDAKDYIGGYDGVISGAKFVGGLLNKALAFDGKDDYVSIDNFNVQGNTMTLAAWFKADNFDTHDARIISKATGTAEQDHIWMVSTIKDKKSGTIKLRFRLKTGKATSTLISKTSIKARQWVHVAATYDGSKMRLYVNGSPSGSFNKKGHIAQSKAKIWIGDNPVGNRNFDGIIDQVLIYNQALSANAVAGLKSCSNIKTDKNVALERIGLVVYPNPTTGLVHLKNLQAESAKTYIVSDIRGTVVQQGDLSKDTTEYGLDLGQLSSGIYFVKVNQQVVKVIKE